MFELTLTEKQMQALVGYIDTALKVHGLKIAKEATDLIAAIEKANIIKPVEELPPE